MATYTITLNERTTSGKAIKKTTMRHLNHRLLFTALISMVCATSFAHDIAVANSDSVTIYYIFTNNNTELAVSYQGRSSYDYSDEYSGNVVIPQTVTYNGNTYSVTGIGGSAFLGCSGLTSVTIPISVTNIGGEAFSYCSGLTSVTIPNSVTTISSGTFSFCSGLTSVTIPKSITTIGEYAFSSCSGLTSVTIPNSVTNIGNNAFSHCTGLTSVTIPNSVTTLGYTVFYNCSKLEEVYCLVNKVLKASIDIFWYSNHTNATLYVPASALEDYKTTAPWSEFKFILPLGETGIENVAKQKAEETDC